MKISKAPLLGEYLADYPPCAMPQLGFDIYGHPATALEQTQISLVRHAQVQAIHRGAGHAKPKRGDDGNRRCCKMTVPANVVCDQLMTATSARDPQAWPGQAVCKPDGQTFGKRCLGPNLAILVGKFLACQVWCLRGHTYRCSFLARRRGEP